MSIKLDWIYYFFRMSIKLDWICYFFRMSIKLDWICFFQMSIKLDCILSECLSNLTEYIIFSIKLDCIFFRMSIKLEWIFCFSPNVYQTLLYFFQTWLDILFFPNVYQTWLNMLFFPNVHQTWLDMFSFQMSIKLDCIFPECISNLTGYVFFS